MSKSIRAVGHPHASLGMARPNRGQLVLDCQCLLVRHRRGGRRVAIGGGFVVVGGECGVSLRACEDLPESLECQPWSSPGVDAPRPCEVRVMPTLARQSTTLLQCPV